MVFMMLLGIMAIAGLVVLVDRFEFDNLWLVVLQRVQASGLWGGDYFYVGSFT